MLRQLTPGAYGQAASRLPQPCANLSPEAAVFEEPRVRTESMAAALERVSNGLSTLLRDHVELARIELRQGLRQARIAGLGAGLLLAGYIFLMAAFAMALARAMPTWLAFSLVALGNIAAGSMAMVRSTGDGHRLPHARPPSPTDAPGPN